MYVFAHIAPTSPPVLAHTIIILVNIEHDKIYPRAELIPLEVRQEEQSLETVEISLLEQPKLGPDIEIECSRCNDIMELNSKFDSLVYFCDTCSFGLVCKH